MTLLITAVLCLTLMQPSEPPFTVSLALHEQDPTQANEKLTEADQYSIQIVKLHNEGHLDQAILLAKRLLKIRESSLNSSNVQIASAATTLADLYIEKRNYSEAEPLLQRAIAISEIEVRPDDPVANANIEKYTCVLSSLKKHDKLKVFEERRVGLLKKSAEPDRFWGLIKRITETVTMPKPEYPLTAQAYGLVLIKVHLDEEGRVTKAVRLCGGNSQLIEASETAARQARFKPILVEGKPVRVTGYLAYNFVVR